MTPAERPTFEMGSSLSFRRPPGVTSARLLVDASNTAWAELPRWLRFVAMHGTATQAWYDSVAADRRLAGRTRSAYG